MYITKKNVSGFTIIELIVVVVVIGVLVAIGIVSYGGVQKKAYDSSVLSDIDTMDGLQTSYGLKNNLPGKVYSSGNGTDIELGFTPSSGNVINVFVGASDYCIRGYNPKGTKNSTGNSFTKESSPGVCDLLIPISSIATAWGDELANIGNDLIQTSDGGFAITGSTGGDMFIAKYRPNGTSDWIKTWGGWSDEQGYSIVQTSDGGFMVTGYTTGYGAGNYDMFIAKYNATGDLSWSKTWGGGGYDTGKSIVQTSDGGYAVTGETNSYGAGGLDMYIAKFSSTGTLIWSKTWGNSVINSGTSIIATSDNGFAVTGYTEGYGAGNYDMFIAKYNSTGDLSWSKTWGSSSMDISISMTQTSDGGYAVTGYGTSANDMFIAKYNSTGDLSWSKTWGGVSNSDSGRTIVQTSDGGLSVAGSTMSYGAGNDDMFIAKYNSTGDLSWSKTWGGGGSDYSNSMVQTNDNGYAIAGYTESYGSGDRDVVFVKFSSEGLIVNCSSPMCQSPSARVTVPSITSTSPSPTVTSPSPTVTSPSPTVNTLTPTITSIVSRGY